MPGTHVKVVTLARGILRQTDFIYSAESLMRHPEAEHNGMTLSVVSQPSLHNDVEITAARRLDIRETTELAALLHYAARLRQRPFAELRDEFFAAFAITCLDDLAQRQFNAARMWVQLKIRR